MSLVYKEFKERLYIFYLISKLGKVISIKINNTCCSYIMLLKSIIHMIILDRW